MLSFTYSFKRVSQHPYAAILIKCAILFFTILYVHHSLNQHGSTIGQILFLIQHKFTSGKWIYIAFPVLLIPVNWGLEAKKWQLLAIKIEAISFLQAFQGILSGLTLGFITPHTLGDYAGRIWQLNGENRYHAIASIWLGRLSQMYITLLAGSAALIYFLCFNASSAMTWWLIALAGNIHIVFLLLLLFRERLIRQIHLLPVKRSYAQYLQVVHAYTFSEIVTLLLYAALRYAVFSLQFYCILLLFGIALHPLIMVTGIALVFLSKSIIPTFSFLADLGIRESAALYFFGIYGAGATQIVGASLSLWLLNILIPAAIGSFFVFKMKLAS